jgi:integrase
MATILNRSRYTVSVKRHPELDRTFAFSALNAARAHLADLRGQGHKAELSQAEDRLVVRIREKGHPELCFPASSYAEAETAIKRIESERETGLFIDYSAAHRVTFAALLREYIEDPAFQMLKGYSDYRITLNGMLSDSVGELAREWEQHDDLVAAGLDPKRPRARRRPRRSMEWMQKRFAAVKPNDLQTYIHDRLDDGLAYSTVDREIDLLSAFITWATEFKQIHLNISPLVGVRRPKYYNERDRRLVGDEEERLLEAARFEDRVRSLDLAVEARLGPAREAAKTLPNATARKRYIAAAREQVIAELGETYPTIRLYETLIQFLLATAARRGEALGLTWTNLQLDRGEAFLPTTKNGRSRTLPVREHVVALLEELPQATDKVFPISTTVLKDAWARMCKRADLNDFHLHDLRHTATSEIAEAFRLAGQPLGIHELAAITGHRDPRCLARYCHMSASLMAKHMDQVYRIAATEKSRMHKGRRVFKAAPSSSNSTPPAAEAPSAESVTAMDLFAQLLDGPCANLRPV